METKEEKYYSVNELLMEFNNLNDEQTISILYTALGYMEEHNSRTKSTCIFMSMGYENIEGDCNTWTKKN